MIGVIGGKIGGFDLFGWSDTLEKSFSRMLRSYVLEALVMQDTGSSLSEGMAFQLISELRNSRIESIKGPGRGEYLLIQGDGLKAMALVNEGRLIHLYGA